MTDFERDLEEVLEGLKLYNDEGKEELYEAFETVLCREEGAAYYGLMQPFHRDVTEDSTEKDVKAMVASAEAEGRAVQNISVYRDLLTCMDKTNDLESFINYVQKYVNFRSNWEERDGEAELYEWADVKRANFEQSDYVEEIVEDLVAKTMDEAFH